jgi:YesN/AraC family two-component response regulator
MTLFICGMGGIRVYSIYIVDDELPIVQLLLNSIPWLEHGFGVIGNSTNPQTAYTEIIEKKPDVVFSDLRMPDENDGIKLIEKLMKNGAQTEFVMLSAYDDYSAVREFFLMGGVDYLLKPLDNDNAALVLEKLSRKLANKHKQTPTVQFVPSQSKGFDELIEYVTANFNKKLSLIGLSEKFNMNQTYICDLFTKHYSSTFTVFISNLRMREASRLIVENDVPLKQISSHCGYSDYQKFCTAFKQHFGKTPTEYKEETE